jgi:GH43 family beta-xylosidase
VYFAADHGKNENHRLWMMENASPDPMQGTWTIKGKLADRTDKWAIDNSVFEHRGKFYLVWSGWEGDVNGRQDIYLDGLKNPWSIKGPKPLVRHP